MNNYNPNRKKKALWLRWVILLTLIAFVFLAINLYYRHLLSPRDLENNEAKIFIIKPGESTMGIAKRLENERLIKSANAFTILARSNKDSGQIQAGEFEVSASMTAGEILKKLMVGIVDKKVTIVEGWRIEEIAEKLNKEMGIEKEEFLKVAKEGYMFPDTYQFSPKASAFEVAQVMRGNFNQKYDVELQSKIKNLGLTAEGGVILASIVEREARTDEPRRMVASILLKRYRIGMVLNADATVQYILGYQPIEKSWWKRNLTRQDLQIESPFNTYLNSGLPPAPIANPGLSSLKAVADADPTTPYLYYFHDSKGKSYYARTLDEHNANVAKYR